jgi:hypothetical protein
LTETPAAFARRLGVHKSTVCRAIQAGRLIVTGGMLDVADSLQRWEDTKPGTRPDVLARHAAKRAPAIPWQPGADKAPQIAAQLAAKMASDPAENAAVGLNGQHDENDTEIVNECATDELTTAAGQAGDGPGISHYAQALLSAQNAMARLSIQMRSHRRYRLEDIDREARSLGSTLRGALERLVDQTAPRLAVMETAEQRLGLLSAEASALRRMIRRELPRALRRLRAPAK